MIILQSDIESVIGKLKSEGKKIVFTNGVFDVIHRGHIDYLNKAKRIGDILVVAINSDSSVRRLKGEGRPVNCQEDRIIVADSLKPVDYIVLFETDTPYEIIRLVMPDVLVKGGDYDGNITDPDDKKYIVGSDIVKKSGGTVVTVDLVPGRSSTNTIKKLQEQR
jgi:D-beta-D-heptose 7-phosphate kinase/D-beta-D-heptose 1-phosphate adenosyltransferase